MPITLEGSFTVNPGEVYQEDGTVFHYLASDPITFENYGVIRAGKDSATAILSEGAPGTLTNYGLIEVSSWTDGWAFYTTSPTGAIVNQGTISVTADYRAYVLEAQAIDQTFVNTGRITVSGQDALGVMLESGGTVRNSGSIILSGHERAIGVRLAGPDSYFGNTGVLTVTSRGDPSIGVLFTPRSDTTPDGWSLVNSHGGTITADIAITVGAGPPYASVERIYNEEGTINGDIALGAGDDVLHNGGRINGDIDMGAGDDTVVMMYGARIEGTVRLGAGDDWVAGRFADAVVLCGAGDDVVAAGSVGIFDGEEGDDIISASGLLLGGSGADTLTGGAGADILDGGTGADAMTGGAGDDVFYVDQVDDVVIETYSTHGFDTVHASVSYTLGRNVEMLVLDGDQSLTATGNYQANWLIGNAAENVLDGGRGADAMSGGDGDDTYYVDNAGDLVIEVSPTGGVDTVISSVSFTLGANIENLTLTGSGVSGRGNDLDNVVTGNDRDNFLRGKAGADVMIGGAGDDRYEVDDAGDQVVEASSSGRDWVYSSISYVLPANVEALTLTGEDWINATGNTKGNAIYGNSGRNVITGGRGSDVMTGKASSDTFVFTSILDSTLDDPDRITDLNDKSDKLDFRQIDGDVNTAGVQGFTIVDAFTGQAGELVLEYNAATDITALTIDVNGDGVADMLVRLNGEHESFDRFLFGGG